MNTLEKVKKEQKSQFTKFDLVNHTSTAIAESFHFKYEACINLKNKEEWQLSGEFIVDLNKLKGNIAIMFHKSGPLYKIENNEKTDHSADVSKKVQFEKALTKGAIKKTGTFLDLVIKHESIRFIMLDKYNLKRKINELKKEEKSS